MSAKWKYMEALSNMHIRAVDNFGFSGDSSPLSLDTRSTYASRPSNSGLKSAAVWFFMWLCSIIARWYARLPTSANLTVSVPDAIECAATGRDHDK